MNTYRLQPNSFFIKRYIFGMIFIGLTKVITKELSLPVVKYISKHIIKVFPKYEVKDILGRLVNENRYYCIEIPVRFVISIFL